MSGKPMIMGQPNSTKNTMANPTLLFGVSVSNSIILENIRIPLRLFGGSSDLLADLVDLQKFWDEVIPLYKQFYQIYNAGHCTFMWGINTAPWMNDVLRMLK